MSRIRYEPAWDVCRAVDVLLELSMFNHVRRDRVYCVRSFGARTSAVARIHGCPPIWRLAGVEASYIIEVVAEKFYKLPPEEKVEVIVHELLHIPKTFSGALRPHGGLVSDRSVRRVMGLLRDKGLLERAWSVWRA